MLYTSNNPFKPTSSDNGEKTINSVTKRNLYIELTRDQKRIVDRTLEECRRLYNKILADTEKEMKLENSKFSPIRKKLRYPTKTEIKTLYKSSFNRNKDLDQDALFNESIRLHKELENSLLKRKVEYPKFRQDKNPIDYIVSIINHRDVSRGMLRKGINYLILPIIGKVTCYNKDNSVPVYGDYRLTRSTIIRKDENKYEVQLVFVRIKKS